jgi:flagellar L-ring protein FlgH
MNSARTSAVRVPSLLLGLLISYCAAATDSGSMLDTQSYRSLVADEKAASIGDVLTVIVHESASATSTAELRAQRSFRIAAQVAATKAEPYSASAGNDSESEGAGRTQRSGRLLAQLSVRVTDMNENGDLVVQGQQNLRINGEEQLITLSGVVRPRDISDGNTVLSSRIAEAKIEFHGKGFVARQSKPGWLARFFSWLGL